MLYSKFLSFMVLSCLIYHAMTLKLLNYTTNRIL